MTYKTWNRKREINKSVASCTYVASNIIFKIEENFDIIKTRLVYIDNFKAIVNYLNSNNFIFIPFVLVYTNPQ